MTDTARIGSDGEDAAADWLTENGFEILDRNWRHGRYEIDIVARRDSELHIVEVKCRAKGGLTLPEDAVTPAKFASLAKAAEAYLEENGMDIDTRFDLVAVTHKDGAFTVEYIPDAMLPGW